MSDPKTIYLQPTCCVNWQGEGRQWCEDDPWEHYCNDGERKKAVLYVRADTIADQAARIEQLEAVLRNIEKRDGCGPEFIICHECRQSSMEATAALQETDDAAS